MYQRIFRLLPFVALLLCLHFQPAYGTTIDPITWEQFASDADFIGIVECETAGGIVAKYRVLESWKGAPAGTAFSIRVAVNYWEPQFPIALIGEQYLVAAFRSNAPSRIMSTTVGSPVPLWWRNIPADYSLPLFQGRVLLPLRGGGRELYAIGSDHPDLKSFKEAAQQFLALSPDQREVRLLQRLSEKYLFDTRSSEKDKNTTEIKTLRKSVLGSSSAKEIVDHLLNLAKKNPEEWRHTIANILAQSGGATTLKILEENSTNQSPLKDASYVIDQIRKRHGLPRIKTEKEDSDTESPKAPTEKEISEMRELLASEPTDEQFYKVFEVMSRYDPEPIADYLVRWVNPEKTWRDTDYGYVIGSYFAWRCGKNRAANLRRLLRAHDSFIRVAGAVYLCYENKEEGIARLREFVNLPGDAGVWAAINLARRGDRSVMPRALDVFATIGPSNMSGVPHQNLQKRVLTLISNSAHKSGIPQPSIAVEVSYIDSESARREKQKKIHQDFLAWWDVNKDRIVLYDPWLTSLELQKVD
jgi:hypothetical protein